MHSRSLVSRVIPAMAVAMVGTMGLAIVGASGAAFAEESGSQVRIHSTPTVTQDRWSPTGIQDQQEQLSENISYADLNLSTSSGARELKSRARNAAHDICQKLSDDDQSNRGPGALEHQIQCVNGALDEAMPQINRVIASAEK